MGKPKLLRWSLDKPGNLCNHVPMKPVKPGPDPEYVRADQERRRSNAAVPQRNKRKYRRTRKHRKADDNA